MRKPVTLCDLVCQGLTFVSSGVQWISVGCGGGWKGRKPKFERGFSAGNKEPRIIGTPNSADMRQAFW